MASIDGTDLVRGDILICKSFALGMTDKHAIIRAGQFLTGSPIRSNSVHAAISITTAKDAIKVIESTGEGVNEGGCEEEADVFRFSGSRALAEKAADVAIRLKDWTANRKTSGGKPAGHYNKWRSAFSVVRPESYDAKAQKLVSDLKSALDNGTDYEDGFFCSMLVVLCYDVAGEELKLPAPPIPKDPMNLNPSNLNAYLLNNPNDWDFVGTLNEGASWSSRIFQRETSH